MVLAGQFITCLSQPKIWQVFLALMFMAGSQSAVFIDFLASRQYFTHK